MSVRRHGGEFQPTQVVIGDQPHSHRDHRSGLAVVNAMVAQSTSVSVLIDTGDIAPMSTSKITIRLSRFNEGARVIEIWRCTVDASHDFLTAEDRAAIDIEVCAFLPRAPLWLAVNESDQPLAFMLVDDGHMEALFVDPAFRRQGIGAALVRHGLAIHPAMTTDVNDQNDQAVRIYEQMGFRRTGRSPVDRQGRPYPLIHLACKA
jgi:putative acetyltransferase